MLICIHSACASSTELHSIFFLVQLGLSSTPKSVGSLCCTVANSGVIEGGHQWAWKSDGFQGRFITFFIVITISTILLISILFRFYAKFLMTVIFVDAKEVAPW